MKTYPEIDSTSGAVSAFEIESVYISLSAVAKLLSLVEGVSSIRRRRRFGSWEEIHIWFQYQNEDCCVWEPFGDNSRYWIGARQPSKVTDFREVEAVFQRFRPRIIRKIVGNVLMLRLRSE